MTPTSYYEKNHGINDDFCDGRFFMSKEMLGSEYANLPKKMDIGYDPVTGEEIYVAITNADKEVVYDFIDRAVLVPPEKEFIDTLYWEEIGDYLFEGKSLEDTVKVMDNRMQTYLAEKIVGE